jgi:hypothetical protein
MKCDKCGRKMNLSGFIKRQEPKIDRITGKPYMIRNSIHMRPGMNPARPVMREVVYDIWRCGCGKEVEQA